MWDGHDDAEIVYQAAVSELATIRAMIDLIEGCDRLEGGTVYEFRSPTNVRMWRSSNVQMSFSGPAGLPHCPQIST